MFSKEQFDRLLHHTMLQFDGEDYISMFRAMDTVLWYINDIEKVQLGDEIPSRGRSITIVQRTYDVPSIDIKKNSKHPIAGNMIQIKFKR